MDDSLANPACPPSGEENPPRGRRLPLFRMENPRGSGPGSLEKV
jgi:hypothetical protein